MDDDLISRQAAIDAYLETVEPIAVQEWDGEISACARDMDILEMLENLPSVQPKTGQWIPHKAPFPIQSVYSCSKCSSSVPGNIFVVGCDFEFCPYCGARMEEIE